MVSGGWISRNQQPVAMASSWTPGLSQIFDCQHILPDDTRVSRTPIYGHTHNVIAVLEARHPCLPFAEDRPGIFASLYLRASKVSRVRRVRRHASSMDIALVLRERKNQTGAVEIWQATFLMSFDEHFLGDLLRLLYRDHVTMRKCIVRGMSGFDEMVGQPAQCAISPSPVQSITCFASTRVSPSLFA